MRHIAALGVAAFLATCAPASAADAGTEFFKLDWGVRATDLTVGPDGNVWFGGITQQTHWRNVVGRVDRSGQVTEYPLEEGGSSHLGVGGLAAGSDGAIWFTQPRVHNIRRIDLSGNLSEYQLPDGGEPGAIARGPDEALWFTQTAPDAVGRISVSGQITEIPLPAGAGPSDIVSGPDGALWVTERGADQIARVTTTGQVSTYPLSSGGEPNEIAVGPDGNLWFTELDGGIGRITPGGDEASFAVPGEAKTEAIASGPESLIWFSSGLEVGSITPSGVVGDLELLDPEFRRRPPGPLLGGPDGRLWFGAKTEVCGGGGGTAIACAGAPGWMGRFAPPSLRVGLGRKPSAVIGGRTRVPVNCAGGVAGQSCSGALQIRDGRGRALARRRFTQATGHGRRIAVRLNRVAIRRLSAGKRLRVRVVVRTREASSAARRMVLRRRR